MKWWFCRRDAVRGNRGNKEVWVAEWGRIKEREIWPRRSQEATEKVNDTLEMLRDWGEQKVKRSMIGEATKCKKKREKKSQGANGVANQSWVMTTLPWVRRTDGDHLSASALPWLPRLLARCAESSPVRWTPPPPKLSLHACKQQIHPLSPVRLCLICRFLNP